MILQPKHELILPPRLARRSAQRGFMYVDPYRFGAAVPGDQLFLLHLDTDSPWTDSSAYGRTVSTNGANVVLDTTNKLFGAGCLSVSLAGGAFGNLRLPSSADFNLSSGQFTIRGFIRPTVLPTASLVAQTLFDEQNAGTIGWRASLLYAGGSHTMQIQNASAVLMTNVAHGMSVGNWYFFAFVRDVNTYRWYLGPAGGTAVQMSSGTGQNPGNVNGTFTLGSDGANANGSSCEYEEWELRRNICLYPSGTSFTVPTATFPTL